MRARKGRVGVQGKELETCRHRIDHATAAGRRVSNPAIIPGLFCRAAHSDNVREPLDWTQARTMPMTNDTAKEPMAGTTRVWLKLLKKLTPVAGILVFLAIWQAGVVLYGVPSYLLPAPTEIARTFIDEFPKILRHGWVTTYEMLLGYALAVVIAIPLAIA